MICWLIEKEQNYAKKNLKNIFSVKTPKWSNQKYHSFFQLNQREMASVFVYIIINKKNMWKWMIKI